MFDRNMCLLQNFQLKFQCNSFELIHFAFLSANKVSKLEYKILNAESVPPMLCITMISVLAHPQADNKEPAHKTV